MTYLYFTPAIYAEVSPTLNRMGTSVSKIEEFANKFINYAESCDLPVMSVGEGTGNVVNICLKKNITFIANDMDKRHLAHIYSRIPEDKTKNLYLKAGKYPDDVILNSDQLGAIYFGRVLHFLTGEEIEKSFRSAYNSLKQGGKILRELRPLIKCT